MTQDSALNLFIIGPSGCGKSTQAKLIANKYKLKHLSMGQLLRDEIASKTKLGLSAQESIDKGVWAPNEIIYPILINALKNIDNRNFILDGFPRLVEQGVFIENYLSKKQQPLDLIILLDVTFEEILVRRQKMGQQFQDGSRSDNTPPAIAKRQTSYNQTIDSIKQHFSQTNKLFSVDGNRPIEPIFTDICQKINSLTKN